MNYLVIGGGQASLSAISKLRELDSTSKITLLSEESVLPYQRPPLSKSFLRGETSIDRLSLRGSSWFSENDISVHLSTCATSITRESCEVTTSTGDIFPYDKLLLALGSSARHLPDEIGGNLAGVHTLRSIADSVSIGSDLKSSKNLVIIGGGYIGLEVAAIAVEMGLSVNLIEVSSRILSRVACTETSDYFRKLHESRGVIFHESTTMEKLHSTADGRVSGVELNGGEILSADCVLCGLGIIPNTDLATGSDLVTDDNSGGIVIDRHCCTSDSRIYAAGDCSNYGGRIESVPNAIHQGELSAYSMTGNIDDDIIDNDNFVPWFWSDQYDVKLQIAGLNTGYDSVLTRSASRGSGYSIWYFSGERFLGVDSMNDATAFMTARRFLSSGVSPDKGDVIDSSIS